MSQIIRCKLERWGGKGGDMKVVLSMSKRYAGIIAQIPEDGDILLKPLQLQPELPLLGTFDPEEMEGLEESDSPACYLCGQVRPDEELAQHSDGRYFCKDGCDPNLLSGQETLPLDGDGRDPTRAADWFDFNEEPARCDFCKEEFGITQLRRWRDPEMPQGFWCRECGVAEKLIGARPPTLDVQLNEYLCKCFKCRGDHAPGEMRRWKDERVAYLGYWCEKCAKEAEGPTPWEVESPAANAEAFEETAAVEIEQLVTAPGLLPWFHRPSQPLTEGAEVLEIGSKEHRKALQEFIKSQGGWLRFPREHLEPYAARKWAKDALAALEEGETGAQEEEPADVDPRVPPNDWEIQGERLALEKEPGTDDHRSAVRILLSHGEEVSYANLARYVDEPWAREEMTPVQYQAARDLAAAKKLKKNLEAEPSADPGAETDPGDPNWGKDIYQCPVCRASKKAAHMEEYFIDNGEGRFICHDCLDRIGMKREDVPQAFTEEVQCGECYRLIPLFVMKTGRVEGELYCPSCHEHMKDASPSAPTHHA